MTALATAGVLSVSRRDLWRRLGALTLGASLLDALTPDAAAQSLAAPREPVLLLPGEGDRGRVGANDLQFKLTGEHTAGLLASAEATLAPGFLGAPPHRHLGTDEVALVLEGELTVLVEEQPYTVPAGGWHLRPRGLVHTFWNAGAMPVRFVDFYLPASHEAYMRELAALFAGGGSPPPGALAELASRHDIEFAWEQLPAIMERYGVRL